jgi:multidrug efflux system membrane fusion protein
LTVDALGADGKAVLDKGKVVVVDNQVDPTTGTVKIKGEFPNADLQLWPGQFVNIQLLINTLRQVVVVPTAAVQRGPNGPFVYVIKDDSTVTVRPVTLTKQDDREAVIGTGLRSGDQVVTTGFARLTEGTKVVVSSANDAGQTPPGGAIPKGGDRKRAPKGGGERAQTSSGPPSRTP